MPRKKRGPMSPDDIIQRIKESGMSEEGCLKRESVPSDEEEELDTLEARIGRILSISNDIKRKSTDMLFFVMYDIENNKVRTLVSKYLVRIGCHRIQRSIFLADLPPKECDKIKQDLSEVQACYDNHDSILVVPISTDMLRAMRVIGQTINLDLIMQNKSTMFF